MEQHKCNWLGCEEQVPIGQWACEPHWQQLPPHIRGWINETYIPRRFSKRYAIAKKCTLQWIAKNG